MNSDKTVEADGGRGRTLPEMTRVMFGWVRENGCVETEAIWMPGETEGDEGEDGGREAMKGIEGVVKLNVSGAGSMIVASALRIRLLDSVDTPNDWRVTSSGKEGKGVLRLGVGNPGNGGTVARGWTRIFSK
jgi:hypothetical protein